MTIQKIASAMVRGGLEPEVISRTETFLREPGHSIAILRLVARGGASLDIQSMKGVLDIDALCFQVEQWARTKSRAEAERRVS